MHDLSLAIVGADFPNKRGPGRRFEIALCAPGELIELRPEPTNKKDPQAVAVYSCRGVQIGYVRAERAPYVRLLLKRHDVVAIFQASAPWGAIVRIGLDGLPPAIPQADIQQQDEPDFWPYEMWPSD